MIILQPIIIIQPASRQPSPPPGAAPAYCYEPSRRCTCPRRAWMAIIPPPPCPVHGQARWLTVTCEATGR